MKCSGIYEARIDDAISVEDMRAYEVNSMYLGISLDILMENAGRSIADVVECRVGDVRGLKIAVLAGKGGNGGDGLVAARHLSSRGAIVDIHLSHDRRLITHKSTLMNLKILEKSRYARIIEPWRRGWIDLSEYDIVIDGLLGIGVKGGLREPILSMAREFTRHQGLRISIDTPTGVDPDTGTVANGAVVADITVTLHKPKRGLFKGDAPLHTGEVLVADIGIPRLAEESAGPGDVSARVPLRPKDSHKGMGGRVLIIGGSIKYIGAPILSALAASRTGADLVYLAAPGSIPIIAAERSSTIIPVRLDGDKIVVGHIAEIMEIAKRVHSIVLGPGIGDWSDTLDAVEKLIEEFTRLKKPVIIDADGLKAINCNKLKGMGNIILTPHRGEAARLLGSMDDPLKMSRTLSDVCNSIVIVKGPIDHICGAGKCRVNYTGTPSMSVGGTGDVLTGVIAAFTARREALGYTRDLLNITAAAAYLVGRAGELAVESIGENISAFDLINYLDKALREARILAEG